MIWTLLIPTVILLAVMDRLWLPAVLKALIYHGKTDCIMAEPDEMITWDFTVENQSKLPIPFVRLKVQFPWEATLHTEKKANCRRGLKHWTAEEKLSIRSYQCIQKKLRFSLPRRGVYEVGNYQLSAGDLFGMREKAKFGGGENIVIIPSKCKNLSSIQALGGFIGDISVRRFIMDDPVLTVGFRDYTGREPLKSISWTRTAMAGSLQVKEFDRTAEQNVTVLLNVSGGSSEELEECFSLTRSVCELLEKQNIPYGFRTNGNLPGPTGAIFKLPEGLGGNHLATILYGLGRADYTCFHSFSSLIRQALQHRKHNESYIVITPHRDDQEQQILCKLQLAASNPICVLVGKAVDK